MQVLFKTSLVFALSASLPSTARAEDFFAIPPAGRPVAELARAEKPAGMSWEQQSAYRAWKRSLIPVLASQALDTASSYGMRELNPLLADSSGRFGAKAAGIKFGSTAAILLVEYWIVRKHPGAARVLTKLNWSGAAVTSGLAAHNFAIR
jgi:hypothetical protein